MGLGHTMMRTFGLAAAFASGASALFAGGLERTTQSPAILFEDGRYFEVNMGLGFPDVSGVAGAITPGARSGNMTENFLNFGFAYKADLSDKLSYALVYDQPYGAKVAYPDIATTGYFAGGSTAEFKSHALSGILKYNVNDNVSVYGGLRAQSIKAEADVTFLSYTADTDADFRLGYLVGAAYEKPEIALRVALTYHSKVNHKLDTVENSAGSATVNGESVTEIEMPQAINLEFQSGVAEDTLVFGSVRWVDWSESDISPATYIADFGGSPLVSFTDDRTTYTLGVGRRLNETWSIAGSVSYEETTGSITGNLAPTDGFKSVGLAAIYSKDNVKITTGIRYVEVGRAFTTAAATFENNSAIGAGVKVGWSF